MRLLPSVGLCWYALCSITVRLSHYCNCKRFSLFCSCGYLLVVQGLPWSVAQEFTTGGLVLKSAAQEVALETRVAGLGGSLVAFAGASNSQCAQESVCYIKESLPKDTGLGVVCGT